MEGQGVMRYTQTIAYGAGGRTAVAIFNKNFENFQPRFLRKGGEGVDCMFYIHMSIVMDKFYSSIAMDILRAMNSVNLS